MGLGPTYQEVKQDSRLILGYYDGSGFCPASTLNKHVAQEVLYKWANTRSGQRNPSRRIDMIRGNNASTNYTEDETSVSLPGSIVRVFWTEDKFCGTPSARKRGLEERYANWSGLTPTSVGDPSLINLSVADNRALVNAWRAVRQIQTSWQGLTWLGELAETLRLLRGRGRDLFGGIRSLPDAFKKKRKGKGRMTPSDRARMASDLWLEHVFGWAPLFSDIRSANGWLERRLNMYQPSYPFKGTGTDETSSSVAQQVSYNDRLKTRHVKNSRQLARVVYYGRVSAGSLGSFAMESRLIGLDWSNILPAAYELTPYSFLVDYFSNLGSVVDAWSVCSIGIKWTSRGTLQEYSIGITDTQWDAAAVKAAMGAAYTLFNPSGSIQVLGKHSVSRRIKTRARDAALLLPGVEFRIPGLGLKWLNMGALLAARSLPR